jgi:hypothetical protein
LLGFIDYQGDEIIKPSYDEIYNEEILEGEIEGKRKEIKH